MKSILLTFLLFFSSTVLFSQSVKIAKLEPDQVQVQGFSLPKTTIVKIEGSGAVFTDEWQLLLYYGWIINADTRRVVWHLFDFMKQAKAKDADGVFDFTSEVELPAGNYELYYAAMHENDNFGDWEGPWTVDNFGDLVDKFFYSRDRERFKLSMAENLFIKLSGTGLTATDYHNQVEKLAKDAILSFNRVGDNENLRKGFTLTADTRIRLYGIGEGRKKEIFDYFWICDAATRERVYKMDYMNTGYAGGAKKNLQVDEVIMLKKGSYIVSYVSDDSHSTDRWNALPPDDLQFWGVTLWPATPEDRKNVTAFVEPKALATVVELVGVRNNELKSSGFTLSRETTLRVLALGEQGDDDGMVDYGWIADARTKEKIWRMKAYRSEHAGGAYKNRMVNELVTLPAGDYLVYYTTDDSHAYESWNDTKPHEDELWGITIWPVKPEDAVAIARFDPKSFKNENTLVEILMVGDYASLREDFTLDADSKIHVMAIGEGDEGEMYDYGYIKNMDTGMIVYEMDYRNSTHAGGAAKNREFNEYILLPKGNYRLYYKTDGSHSYRDWNSTPPANQEQYGIMLIRE